MLAYHAGASWATGAIFTISMFFTLSGYLITALVLEEFGRHDRVDVRAFWVRRFRRLMPGALVTLGGVVVFGWLVADATQRASLRTDVLAALGYVANWHFIASGTAYLQSYKTPSPTLHFWSLAIEEQFYLVFPILVALLLRKRRRRPARSLRRARVRLGVVFGALFVATAALPFLFHMSKDRIYLGTDTRAPELLMGALLAVVMAGRPMGVAPRRRWVRSALFVGGPVALVTSVVIWVTVAKDADWIYRGGFAAYALVSAVLVASAATPGNPIAVGMSFRPFRWLGERTYGIYLFHFPIFLWLTEQRTGLSFWPLLALRVSLTLALASESYLLIEGPMRSGRTLLRQPLRRLAPVTAVVVVTALLATTMGIQSGTAQAAAEHPEALRVKAGPDADLSPVVPMGADASGATSSTTTSSSTSTSTTLLPEPTTTEPPPVAGPFGLVPKPLVRPQRKLRLLILGDSTGVFLAYALNAWNDKAQIFDLSSYALMGCGLVRGGTEFASGIERTFDPTCFQWADHWRQAIDETKPDVIMVANAFHDVTDRRLTPDGPWQHIGQPDYDRYLLSEYRAAADELGTAGVPVLWLDNPPVREGQNQPDSNLRSPMNDPMRMAWLDEVIELLAKEKPFIHVVDYERLFETWPGGPFDPRLREDGLHVDYEGRQIVGNWLGPELLDAYWHAIGW
jgi:peptidoglycan/LPS O-acetylase OafA/YrhL